MKIEKLVKFALLNNEAVTEIVAKTDEGIPLIGINHNPVGRYPLIELHSSSGNDQQFADDRVYTRYNVVEVTFYCKDNEYGEVEEEINEMLYDLGFTRINYYSNRNQFTSITEYTVDYRATFSTAMLNKNYSEQFNQLEYPEQALENTLEQSGSYHLESGEQIDSSQVWETRDLK